MITLSVRSQRTIRNGTEGCGVQWIRGAKGVNLRLNFRPQRLRKILYLAAILAGKAHIGHRFHQSARQSQIESFCFISRMFGDVDIRNFGFLIFAFPRIRSVVMQKESHKDFAVYGGNGLGAAKIVLKNQTSVFELRQR